jgi:hypothetical protein
LIKKVLREFAKYTAISLISDLEIYLRGSKKPDKHIGYG